jgi:hypothetical protein
MTPYSKPCSISFVSIVPHDGSSPQTLRITMPTAIAPRYGVPPTNIPWFGKNFQDRFELVCILLHVVLLRHIYGIIDSCRSNEQTRDLCQLTQSSNRFDTRMCSKGTTGRFRALQGVRISGRFGIPRQRYCDCDIRSRLGYTTMQRRTMAF